MNKIFKYTRLHKQKHFLQQKVEELLDLQKNIRLLHTYSMNINKSFTTAFLTNV